MPGGRLPRRDTELVILRVAALRGCAYESHTGGSAPGRARRRRHRADAIGSCAAGWSDRRVALLRVTDSLLATRTSTTRSGPSCRAARTNAGCIELLLLVGHYDMLATTLNTLRVQPEKRERT